MKGDLHVRFGEKFEVKIRLLTRLRGERKSPLLDYNIGVFLPIKYLLVQRRCILRTNHEKSKKA